MEITVRRDIASLGEIFDFIDSYASRQGLDSGVQFSIRLAVEELFTNMVKYNRSRTESGIEISLEQSASSLILRLTDFNVDAFDIRTAKEPDTAKPLGERKVGGLGIHLLKRMVDTIDYEYADGKSTVILTKNLEQT